MSNEPELTADAYERMLRARWAEEEAGTSQAEVLAGSGFELFRGVHVDGGLDEAKDVISVATEKTELGSITPQDPARVELVNVPQADNSSCFVPIQVPKPVESKKASVAVTCKYIQVAANLAQISANTARTAAKPFKDAGDIVGLMVQMFGPGVSTISEAGMQGIFLKIVALATALLQGSKVSAIGANVNVKFDPMELVPEGDQLPILLPLELDDDAKGLLLTALLPNRELLVLCRADERFMAAFFRHDIDGINNVVVALKHTIPFGAGVNSRKACYDVLSYARKVMGDGLYQKIQRTVGELSTVYGPVRLPNHVVGRAMNLGTPSREVNVFWETVPADAADRTPRPGNGTLVALPGLGDEPPAGPWAMPVGAAEVLKPNRAPSQASLEAIARACVNNPAARVMAVSVQPGREANPFTGAAARPAVMSIEWQQVRGAQEVEDLEQPLQIELVAAVPQWAQHLVREYRALVHHATGWPISRFEPIAELPGYHAPDDTREHGVRDVYGLIDANSRQQVPQLQRMDIGPIVSGFLELVPDHKPVKARTMVRGASAAETLYRGRVMHYAFNAMRFILQQDPAQTWDSGIQGNAITERFKAPLSSYTGPCAMDESTDPGPTLEVQETSLILRQPKALLPMFAYKGGASSVAAVGQVRKFHVLGNNRVALDSSLRALGASGPVDTLLFADAPFRPAAVVNLAQGGGAERLIAPFSLPSHIRTLVADAKEKACFHATLASRNYFCGNTSAISERLS